MKKIIILLVTVACTSTVFAQMDIATARQQAENSEVTVTELLPTETNLEVPFATLKMAQPELQSMTLKIQKVLIEGIALQSLAYW